MLNRKESLSKITRDFYRENKQELFLDNLQEISRIFAKALKKQRKMNLADELAVAETISVFLMRDIRALKKAPDSTIPRKIKKH